MTEKEYPYVMEQLVMMTGLTDRTIRSHLAKGFLTGKKIDGAWHFSREDVEAFLTHPSVRPGILAKQNGQIYDFLACDDKKEEALCMILDLPGRSRMEINQFFCKRICQEDIQGVHFSFDGSQKARRVILTGKPEIVLKLANEFYALPASMS